jgi:PilZ domain-containing protein
VVRDCQQVFGKRQEWCVEAINPNSKIWGVDFNQSAEESKPMVLIECGTCNNTAYISLTSTEYSILLSVGMISHHCKCCDQTTRWKPRLAAPKSDGIDVNGQPVFSDSKTRKMRRLGMAMRVHVRNGNGIAEIVQTRDVSKDGLCFAGSQDFRVGDDIYVTFPFVDPNHPAEVKGMVRWSSQGLSGRSYGVSYVKAN